MSKYLVIIILFGFVFSACQKTLIKKEIKKAEVDSSLYFEQIEISDPFLDNLSQNDDQIFELKKTVFPPPPEKPLSAKFKTIEGFRVQIYAGVDLENALANKSMAKNSVSDTIYQFNDKGLIKLQVGDYPYYPQADSIKRIFRQTHFPGAWIVKTNILIPNVQIQTDSVLESKNTIKKKGKFKIQVIATGDEQKAQTIVDELKMQFRNQVFYEGIGNVYKVFVGYFVTEDEARKALKTIRDEKYTDAWLVY